MLEPVSIPKLLIVSPQASKGGISSFVSAMQAQLSKDFEVSVLQLDQYILLNPERRAVAAGDKLVQDVVTASRAYDVINLQWDPPTLGARRRDILRRFRTLVRGIDKLVITVHGSLPLQLPLTGEALLFALVHAGPRGVWTLLKQNKSRDYVRKTYRVIRDEQRRKPLALVAHTRRERKFLESVIQLTNVHDHPLSLFDPKWFERLAADGEALRGTLRRRLGSDSVFVGLFGSLASAKSFETAIRAFRYLPDNYHLLIYSGIHAVQIKELVPVDPYVRKLIEEIVVPEGVMEALARSAKQVAHGPLKDFAGQAFKDVYMARRPLTRRVHFMGAPDDYDFAVALKAMDICTFPHQEGGQSASAAATQAIELGKRVITTNTRSFVELGKYYPARFHCFDVGNHLQLAQLVQSAMLQPEPASPPNALGHASQRTLYRDIVQTAQSTIPAKSLTQKLANWAEG